MQVVDYGSAGRQHDLNGPSSLSEPGREQLQGALGAAEGVRIGGEEHHSPGAGHDDIQRHSIAFPPVTVAFVHDNLVQRGGSERVLLSMLAAFPGAPVFTAFYRPEATYPALMDHDVRAVAMNRVGALRRHHRAAFPALPFVFSRLDVDADVVVCSSSGWAQGVRTSGRKVVYFHALAQWLHSPVGHVAGD